MRARICSSLFGRTEVIPVVITHSVCLIASLRRLSTVCIFLDRSSLGSRFCCRSGLLGCSQDNLLIDAECFTHPQHIRRALKMVPEALGGEVLGIPPNGPGPKTPRVIEQRTLFDYSANDSMGSASVYSLERDAVHSLFEGPLQAQCRKIGVLLESIVVAPMKVAQSGR